MKPKDHNYYGELRVPVLGIRLEQLILILYPTFLIPAVYFWYAHLQKRKLFANRPPGCKQLHRTIGSHPFDRSLGERESEPRAVTKCKIGGIQVYPVQGCPAIDLDEVEIGPSGLSWNHNFLFAEYAPKTTSKSDGTESAYEWRPLATTTKAHARLWLLEAEIWVPDGKDSQGSSAGTRVSRTGALIIKYPNIPKGRLAFLDRMAMRYGLLSSHLSFQVPLTPLPDHKYDRTAISTSAGQPQWLNYEIHLPHDFKEFIGVNSRLSLFRIDPTLQPKASEVPSPLGLGHIDIVNLKSALDLRQDVEVRIPPPLFQANIYVAGLKAFSESDWKKIRIQSSSVDGTQSLLDLDCASRVVTVDLASINDLVTDARRKDRMADLDKLRKAQHQSRGFDTLKPNQMSFGKRAKPSIPGRGKFIIKIGAEVDVLERT